MVAHILWSGAVPSALIIKTHNGGKCLYQLTLQDLILSLIQSKLYSIKIVKFFVEKLVFLK